MWVLFRDEDKQVQVENGLYLPWCSHRGVLQGAVLKEAPDWWEGRLQSVYIVIFGLEFS